ncbi:MAG: alpha/beta hydrolase-fold protein [Pirellulales bacterium]
MLGGLFLAALCAVAPTARASQLVLRDGRILEGRIAPVSKLAENFQTPGHAGPVDIRPIEMCDDNLRRVFVSKRQIAELRDADAGQTFEKFDVRQRVVRVGRQVQSVGPILRMTEFDEFGRRSLTMNTLKGPVTVIQGITEITPAWTKVEGVQAENMSYVWDMRIATSSIPRDTLGKILAKSIDPKNVEHRLKVARLYLQSERYEDARKELEEVIAAFPDMKERIAPSILSLTQLSAQRLLKELLLRRDAGQHRLVLDKLDKFPAENVDGETLQAVREMQGEYRTGREQVAGVLKQFDAYAVEVKDQTLQKRLAPLRQELAADLGLSTLDRMATFRRLADDEKLSPSQKLSLVISGWLLGPDEATENLSVALSLVEVRNVVRQYLQEPAKAKRTQIFAGMGSLEGASAQMVAKLAAHMKPPLDAPSPNPNAPGLFELQVPGLDKEPPVTYWVQLPPEYDPYRRYPTVVTLHGAGTTPLQQIDWWAGAASPKGLRTGQATRYGYIVIAPAWSKVAQKAYGYSAREHAAVLNSLRDACRRFAIDTDRVFLSGHSMGGDASWDIGLAHPDLWAGVIPIVAVSDKYCTRYWQNARNLPFYLVGGELDGDKTVRNARDLDRYLIYGFNTTVVEYLGRGHEHFYDEILKLFEWMARCRRDFFPKEFICQTMRPWDNYFWWVELEDFPPKSTVDPEAWPPARGTQTVQVKGTVNAANGINVSTGAGRAIIWLSPELIDFEARTNIVVNGRRVNAGDQLVKPDLTVLLEDLRARGDRQHPFWAKIETPTGR